MAPQPAVDRGNDPGQEWAESILPSWVPVLACAIAVLAVLASILQRLSAAPLSLPVLYAALILLPFVLDVVDRVAPFRLALPLWLFPVPVLVGTAWLVADSPDVGFAPFALVFVTAEVASRAVYQRWLGVAVCLASLGIMVGFDIFGARDDSLSWVIGISFGWFGGFLVQTLLRTASELKATQADLAERSAAEERSRIAREVHDVIAHSMSVTMLHITAARMALERGKSGAALDALREAEQQGRRSLNDIRHTVGLLGPDESATARPMPGTTDLPNLVSDFRTAGLDVTLQMTGDVAALPPAAGLNLYRITQESLTNVAKHAPGATAIVELTVSEADVRLRVHNGRTNGHPPETTTGGGLGLRGMIERATTLGGDLSADADGGGWTVLLVAPRPTA